MTNRSRTLKSSRTFPVSDTECFSSSFARELISGFYDELCAIDERIQSLEERIRAIFRSNDLCQKIAAVEGVGQ